MILASNHSEIVHVELLVILLYLAHEPNQNVDWLKLTDLILSILYLELLTTFIDDLECFYQSSLYVSDSEGAVTDIVRLVQWIQNYEWVVEGALSWILAEFYSVTVKVEEMRLEADAIEVEEAGKVTAQRFLVVGIEALKICWNH